MLTTLRAIDGRVAWTAAYLALGYAVGTDLEAASGFLTNMSALLVCAAAVVWRCRPV